ncbi:E3 ubiquitin-protein ligase RFWD3 isoform X1 [Prunus yedoensis var. nudiflora]|uniref:E3 ubiquitin-protein ligase RFWD3 isoform X1 n=1 Tax=Prunus yedoensis var. nudiflora TaxID=2094558 RepID=A0A314XX13_PRUYE|nr:E3 ubiquitin-protein ligase RFWD3 isoform X1 [Prunus yedoensis var. nudiflora]
MANPNPSYIEISEDEELQQDQDAEMQNNGDRDDENNYDEDEEVEEFEEEEEEDEEEEEEDEEDDFIDADYATYLAELLPSSFGHHAGGIAGETEARNGPEEGREKRRKIGGPGTSSLGGIGSAEGSQGNEWNRSVIDGLFCPICLDAWTNDGDHRICCLPCGHIYGMSCITKWLQRRNSRKCPQCNQKCKLKDVRKLFVSQVLSVDEESQKRIRVLEDKCASLEEKVADLSKKEAEWLKREGELQQKVQQCTEPSMDSAKIMQSITAQCNDILKCLDEHFTGLAHRIDGMGANLEHRIDGIEATLERLEHQSPEDDDPHT